MSDHDDDSFENINILRMLINLYLQNVKRYLRIFRTILVASQYSTMQCQYLFCIISSFLLYSAFPPSLYAVFSIKNWGPCCSIRLLDMTRIYLMSFGRWVQESKYLITAEYFCEDANILKNCYIFFVGLC